MTKINKLDIMRRFQTTGDAATNAMLANDPIAFEDVSAEALADVSHNRPVFNWPHGNMALGNYFGIESMALDVLKDCGFNREARLLRQIIDLKGPPVYKDLASLLHHFLDFSPLTTPDPAKLEAFKALAEEMGMDPDKATQAPRKKLTNPLAHRSKNMKEEWDWLVKHKDAESPFGKTAACELNPLFAFKLCDDWLAAGPLAAPGDPTNPTFANRAWFEEAFPMSFSNLDAFTDSALVHMPFESFEQRAAVMSYEISTKVARGWSAPDALKFCFDHKNTVDMTGSALIAIEAHDFYFDRVAKALASPDASLTQGLSGLSTHMQRINPGHAPMCDELWAWSAYKAMSPEAASHIEASWIEHETTKSHSKASLKAKVEKIELIGMDAKAFLLPNEELPVPAEIKAEKKQYRI